MLIPIRKNSACFPAGANGAQKAPHPVSPVSHASRYNTLHFASKVVCQWGQAPFGNPHKKRRYAPLLHGGAYRLFLLSSPPAVSVEQKSAWDWCGIFNFEIPQFLIWILTPLNFLFRLWKKFLSLFLRRKDSDKLSQAELLMFVEEVQEDGSIDTNEGHLLRNAIEFGDLKAEDILIHRVDLEALPLNATKQETAEKFESSKFSRLLVYEDDIDNIVGILHLKDFFCAEGIADKPLSKLMTPPLFIHRTEKISDLLKTLQSTKSHMAVVVDEYGGTLGIVTMEDILEELVGDIWDEHDDVMEDVKKTAENTYRVNCGMNIDDFCQQFGINVETESTTLNGWISEQLDKIPEKGDHFTFENLDITVTDTDSHRPLFATVHVTPVEEEKDEEKDRKD